MPSHVDVVIDSREECVVDGIRCSSDSLADTLKGRRQRSGGQCSICIRCNPDVDFKTLSGVMNQATAVGIWDISLQVEGHSEPVDCSRPAVDEFQEVYELQDVHEDTPQDMVHITVSAKILSVNGSGCALSELNGKLKGKTGTAVVMARADASAGQIHEILSTCKSRSLQACLFGRD